ncbi:sodium/proline symporter PutP [Paludifilum halophilum]|uniref:Sodium/proline symporter n=1 Tax=Paludifilum halophilum TaxID=1642702 RepID=A0A235B9V5_9BACL|nr:sodium/proline symporter PutP [Paludifilum halophilum]OYD09051.1 sodium/proline symporter [Paludifilum halophilum]
MSASVITFTLYLIGMLTVGLITYRMTHTFSDYVLGGRRMGSWVTAISAQASDMSGWLLLGLPGLAFSIGMGSIWLAMGLATGTLLNWMYTARRLRLYTQQLNALTLPDYFEFRFRDPSRLLRLLSALLIFVFFLYYTASGLVGGGKLFEAAFGLDYTLAVLIGAVIIVGYTFLGGFFAVSWTDLFQGLLMFVALMVLPVAAILTMGGFTETVNTIREVSPMHVGLSGDQTGTAVILSFIAGNLAWGFGYFGQPHILSRFMAIKDPKMLSKSTMIAVIWVVLTLYGAILSGFVGFGASERGLLSVVDPEQIFIGLANLLFHPVIAGLLLAAIMAAIMSTVDSFLLVTSTAVAEDFYKRFFRRGASEKELIWVGRFGVLITALIAIYLSFSQEKNVLDLVSYAWAGLGGTFGPVVLLSLYWKRMNLYGAFAGLITGAVTILLWTNAVQPNEWFGPAVSSLYELLPAFLLSVLAIIVVSKLTPPPSEKIQEEFDAVISPSKQ